MSDVNREVNRLTDAQRFKLYDEMKTCQPEVTKDKLTPAQLAERISKRLGFEVTKANIKKVADTVELVFVTQGKNNFKRVTDALEVRVSQLEMVVSDLRVQLGLKKAIN